MKKKLYSYKDSGVNISLGNEFVNHISKLSKKNVKKANKNKHSNNIGSFGSLYDISTLNKLALKALSESEIIIGADRHIKKFELYKKKNS